METEKNGAKDTAHRAVIPGQRVRVSAESKRLPVPYGSNTDRQHPSSDHAPVVNAIRRGDSIESIEITCTCGNHIRLLCQHK